MGFGNALAQSVVGALGGASQYVLDREAERRKQERLMEMIQAQKEHKQLLPIEEEKLRAEINALNRRNTGGGGVGGGTSKLDDTVEKMIQAEEESRGSPFTPRQRATAKSRLLQRMVFKPSGTPLLENEAVAEPFSNMPAANWQGQQVPGMVPGAPQGMPSQGVAPQPAPSVSSPPPGARVAKDEAGNKWYVNSSGKVIGKAP